MTSRLASLAHPARLWSALRAPADPESEAGRARDRHRRIALTAATSAAARAITILAGLVTVPLTLHYLGTERYGVWMVLSSFSMMLAFADMGLGNGVLNGIAAAHGRDDRAAIRALVSSGYAALSIIAAAILLGFAVAYPLVDWAGLFDVRGARAAAEIGPALATYIACFALTIPFALVQKVQIALQQGFLTSLWQCAGSVAAMLSLVAVIAAGGGLPLLVLALAGAPLLVAAVNTLWFFTRAGRPIAPSTGAISAPAMREAGIVGLRFFVLQIVASVAYGLDTVIVARVAGLGAVASYAVPERMFAILPLLLAILMQPLWPAYGEAIARGHGRWVRQAVAGSLGLAAAVSICGSALLVAFGNDLLRLWVGAAVTASPLLLAGLGLWKVIDALGTTAAVYLNGANRLGFQIVVAVVTGAAMLGAKIVLVGRIGVAGIPWGAAIPFLVLALIPTLVYIRRDLARRAR